MSWEHVLRPEKEVFKKKMVRAYHKDAGASLKGLWLKLRPSEHQRNKLELLKESPISPQ